jgi:hypothetical protein
MWASNNLYQQTRSSWRLYNSRNETLNEIYPCGSGFESILHIPLRVERGRWMGWSFRWDRKTEALRHCRCDTIKIPPCSKALSAEHRPEFCSPSTAMVTCPYKWDILEWDVKQYIINQSIKQAINQSINQSIIKRDSLKLCNINVFVSSWFHTFVHYRHVHVDQEQY